MNVQYDLECDTCEAVFSVLFKDNTEKPCFCPFCGVTVDLNDIEEDFDLEDESGEDDQDY